MLRAYREDLAFVHDAGFGRVALAAGRLLSHELKSRGMERGRVVDLGCGSGILSAVVAEAGYRVLGVDVSEAMISLARTRVPAGEFRVDSLWTTALPECVAVAIVGEGLNYLFDPAHSIGAIGGLFERVFRALEPGGLLVLDAAGPGRVPDGVSKLGADQGDGWAVMFRSEEADDGILTRRITTFRRIGELYRRDEEVHRQRLIDPHHSRDVLHAAGFHVQVLNGYGDERFPPGLTGFLAEKPV